MALRKVECAFCSEVFETEDNARVYCSERCRRQMAKKRAREKSESLRTFTCNWCGATFHASRKRKYCKMDCRLMANGRKLPREKKTEKPKMTLEQIAKASREEGVSYGQYVQKYGL